MYKIGIIGDKDSIFAFAAIGINTFFVKNETEAKNALNKALHENYGIIFITEQYAKMLSSEIQEYADNVIPSIIPIPSSINSTEYGKQRIREFVERAAGTDVLFGDI